MKNCQNIICFLILSLTFIQKNHAQSSRFSLLPDEDKIISGNTETPNHLFLQYPLNQSIAPIPKAYCYDDLALFCKLEVQLEKAFKFPVKIRLGEVNYVEMLEGKPHSPWTW